MAWTLTFTPLGVAEQTIYISGTTTDKAFLQEENWGFPEPLAQIDPIPNLFADMDRGVSWGPRTYVVTFRLLGSSLSNLETLQATWATVHNAYLGVGMVKRITAGGNTRYLFARPGKTSFGPREGFTRVVTQEYNAADPWWYAAGSTASGAFNGATPTTIAFTNAGDIPSAPQYRITNVVVKPKIALSATEYIEINNSTVNADDLLIISVHPGFAYPQVLYQVHGGGAWINWWGYRTSGSSLFRLPVATASLTLTATSGTATVSVAWNNRYGNL